MTCSHQSTAAALHAAPPQAPVRQYLATAAQMLIARLVALPGAWQHRGRSRRDLQALDERLLKDIGLTRWQVETESSKPFWRV